MVSMALLSMALMAVADLSGNALRNHAYARDLSAATLLARAKMAELEQKYEDQGFRDFDEQEEGDFSGDGHPGVRWHLDLVKPSADLSADQLVSVLGGGASAQDLLAKLMGGTGAASGTSSGAAASVVSSAAAPAAGLLSGVLQRQLTVLGETIKKSFREARLTVSWHDGKLVRSFTVTTHLLVLNPRAPGGARGDNPELPQNLATTTTTTTPARRGP
jgi:general secretion pathway protein I